jgi:hypothetical protein
MACLTDCAVGHRNTRDILGYHRGTVEGGEERPV